MAQTNEIQLLTGKSGQKIDIKTKASKRNKLFIVGAVSLIAVLSVGFFLVYLKSNLKQEIVNIDSELNTLETKRDKNFEKEILVIKKQLILVSDLLDKHTYWTKALASLEDLLQNKVQVVGLEFGVIGNEVSIIGSAANYSVIAKQIASFLSNDLIKDVTLQETKAQNTGIIEFGMKLTINANKLLKNDK